MTNQVQFNQQSNSNLFSQPYPKGISGDSWAHIFEYLPPSDIYKCQLLCKKIRALSLSEIKFKEFFLAFRLLKKIKYSIFQIPQLKLKIEFEKIIHLAVVEAQIEPIRAVITIEQFKKGIIDLGSSFNFWGQNSNNASQQNIIKIIKIVGKNFPEYSRKLVKALPTDLQFKAIGWMIKEKLIKTPFILIDQFSEKYPLHWIKLNCICISSGFHYSKSDEDQSHKEKQLYEETKDNDDEITRLFFGPPRKGRHPSEIRSKKVRTRINSLKSKREIYNSAYSVSKFNYKMGNEKEVKKHWEYGYKTINDFSPRSNSFLRSVLDKYLLQAKLLNKGLEMKVSNELIVKYLKILKGKVLKSNNPMTRFRVITKVVKLEVKLKIFDIKEWVFFSSRVDYCRYLAKIAKELVSINPSQSRNLLDLLEKEEHDPVFISLIDASHAFFKIAQNISNSDPSKSLEDLSRAVEKTNAHIEGTLSRAKEALDLLSKIANFANQLELQGDKLFQERKKLIRQSIFNILQSIKTVVVKKKEEHQTKQDYQLLGQTYCMFKDLFPSAKNAADKILSILENRAKDNISYSLELAQILIIDRGR